MSAHYVVSQFIFFCSSLQWKPYFTYGTNEAVSVFFALLCRHGHNTVDIPKDLMSDCKLSDNWCCEEHSYILHRAEHGAASPEIPRILWNPKVHYRSHK